MNRVCKFYFQIQVAALHLGRKTSWEETDVALDGSPIGPTAPSDWLKEVPWGLRKTLTYVRDRWGVTRAPDHPSLFMELNFSRFGLLTPLFEINLEWLTQAARAPGLVGLYSAEQGSKAGKGTIVRPC
jgi:hypothetical protein